MYAPAHETAVTTVTLPAGTAPRGAAAATATTAATVAIATTAAAAEAAAAANGPVSDEPASLAAATPVPVLGAVPLRRGSDDHEENKNDGDGGPWLDGMECVLPVRTS